MAKVLVTGASGQLGYELSRLLGEKFFGVDVNELDITDAHAVLSSFAGQEIEAIVNCAAYTAVDKAESERKEAFGVNEFGAKNIAALASKMNIPLIHVSTDFVFDGKKSSPYTEDDSVNPLSVYGASKLAGENAVLRECSSAVILRTSWLYSSHGKNFVKTMLHYGRERGHLRVIYDQVGTPTYAADLAAAIVHILPQAHKGFGQVFHFSNEGVASWYDFAHAILGIAGVPCTIEPIQTHEYPTPATRPQYSVMDKSHVKRTFSVVIPHWRDSLVKCLDILGKEGEK